METKISASETARFRLLRISVILAMLAGFALSPKLWLSARLYPLTPVFSFIRPLPSPLDQIVLVAGAVLLIALCIAPRPAIYVAVFTMLALLALQDQSRWQPWFYQYAIMLLAIAIAGAHRKNAAMNTGCLIVAATYIWSGLAKLNPSFETEIFPAFLGPFSKKPAPWLVHDLAIAAAVVECSLGVALLFRRSRNAAVFGAIGMHAFILVVLGPLGRRFNSVVWPWNVAMILFLIVLFFRRDFAWPREFVFQKVVLVLFGVMPTLSFFHLWDDYLSSALYTGNVNTGIVYLSDDAFEQLPDGIQDHVYEEGANLSSLAINDWSYAELNVPAFPQVRIFRNVARHICAYVSGGAGVELVTQGKYALIHSHRHESYRCADLQR